MYRTISLATATLVLAAVSGCGTLYNNNFGACCSSNPRAFSVYGGVQHDLEWYGESFVALADSSTAIPARLAICLFGLTVTTIDLPFTFVADTLELPVTVPKAIGKQRIWDSDAADPDSGSAPSK